VIAVPLAEAEGDDYVTATPDNAYGGDYPLARPLWLSVNYKPGSSLDPLRREFVKYVFSKQGQLDVVKDGYFPVTAAVAAENLEKIGIKTPVSASK
jgi:phosphate transport system substrate-binding protein